MEKNRARMGSSAPPLNAYPLLRDVLAEFFNARLELLAGLQQVIGVVDDMRSHKNDQLAPVMTIGFAAKDPAYKGNAVQAGNAGRGTGDVLGDRTADRNGVAILHRDLGL